MSRRAQSIVSVLLLLATAAGCSFSDSSASISKSISSPFESSSASSPGGIEAYQSDVADYTYAHVISSNQFDAFWKGVANVAERHGVTNWEAEDATYVGIGQGIRRAKLSETQLEVIAKNLSGGDEKKIKLIEKGYNTEPEKQK